jgi:hypothetical protein
MANGASRVVSIPASGGEAGLNRYLSEIKKFPILAPEEEFMLAKRWREHGDTDAAARLVNSHLRLVAKIAMGYRGYGLPVSELISEGNIGLMQGVKKFEPDRGFASPPTPCGGFAPRSRNSSAQLEPGQDGHHRGSEEAVLQPAPDEEPDRRVRGGRSEAGSGYQDCDRPRSH